MSVDGGPDGAVDAGTDGAVVNAPAIPWLTGGAPPILLAPCPEGWREVVGEDVSECHPYPEGGALVCEEGEAHFPGEPGCRPIGEACPSGDYGTSLPTSGPVIYVNASADVGGDGTLGAPFVELAEVPWATLPTGVTVALGKGTYPGTLPLRAGVSVVGACVRETVVTGATFGRSVVSVASAGAPAVVRNLAIRGARQKGVVIGNGRAVSLEGVLIDEVHGGGIVSEDAGTLVTLADVVIRGTVPTGSLAVEAGFGLHLTAAGRLEGHRVILAGNGSMGIFATGSGVAVALTDAVVRDTQPLESDRSAGRGISMQRGARFEGTRLLVTGNRDIGIFAGSPGSTVTLTDAVVENTKPRASDGALGRGITVTDGELIATRVLIAGNRDIGLLVEWPEGRAALTDVVIRDTQTRTTDNGGGRGMSVQFGGRCEATRLLVSGSFDFGVYVDGEGTELVVRDALVQHTVPNAGTQEFGLGITVQDGAHFDGARLVVSDNRSVGLFATGPASTATVSDAVIRDTLSDATDLAYGHGILAQDGASLDGARVEILRSLEVGLSALDAATVTIEDISIHGVEVAECASTTCPGGQYGYGAGAFSGSLSMRRFQVTDTAICGVMVAPQALSAGEPSLDLMTGHVSDSEIGACVQVDGYDIDRLTSEVRYDANGRNLDATMLPVPAPREVL